MPTAPMNTKCRELGCHEPKTSRSTFCANHGGGVTEKGRANSKLYSTASWHNQRKAQLSKYPLCSSCLSKGYVVPAEHVDHVFPHRQDEVRFKVNLFQGLCPSCHTLKTQAESNGEYWHWVKDERITYTEADYNRVVVALYSDV